MPHSWKRRTARPTWPICAAGRCPIADAVSLGRETAIQKMVWSPDGWLRTTDGQGVPQVSVPAPELPPHPFVAPPIREDFDSPELPIDFQWLRTPYPERTLEPDERPGFLAPLRPRNLGEPV